MFITFWKLFFYTHNEGIGPDQRLTSCALGNASCLRSPLMGTKEIWEEAGQASLPLHQPEQHHLRTCLIFCVFKHKFPWEKEKAFATHKKKWVLQALDEVMGSFQVPENYVWSRQDCAALVAAGGCAPLGWVCTRLLGCLCLLECALFMLLQRRTRLSCYDKAE